MDHQTRSQDDLAAELHTLSIGDENRSETAKIAGSLPEIMAAITAGVQQRAIHSVLIKYGCRLSFESFRTTLWRLRQRCQVAMSQTNQTPAESKTDPYGLTSLTHDIADKYTKPRNRFSE